MDLNSLGKDVPPASRYSTRLAFFATIDSVGTIVCKLETGPAVRIEYLPHCRLSNRITLDKVEVRVALELSLHSGQVNNFNRCAVESYSKLGQGEAHTICSDAMSLLKGRCQKPLAVLFSSIKTEEEIYAIAPSLPTFGT